MMCAWIEEGPYSAADQAVFVTSVCVQEPPPAGVVAVGMVLLAGAVTSIAMQRQRKAAELAVQKRKLMQQRAEELRAQKAVSVGCCQPVCWCLLCRASRMLG